jgi:hypothetical protein
MNTVVKTFLLVSAAYLMGGSATALASRDGRESVSRSADGYAMQESAGEEPRSSDLRLPLSRPFISEELMR